MRPENLNKLYVIGIGYKPLEEMAKKILLNSEVILTSERLFEVFRCYDEFEAVKERVMVINNVDETIEFIRSNELKSIVLLASGDPMFFGIGRRVVNEFGKERVEILPDLSSIQVAFSRIKEPWDNAFLMSLHGGPDPVKRRRLPYEMKDIPFLLKKYNKLAILTDRENNPSRIANFLISTCSLQHQGPFAIKIYVCERLGYPDERIIEGKPAEISKMTFRTPNVVVIVKQDDNAVGIDTYSDDVQYRSHTPSPSLPLFGLTCDEISHARGLITKDEVRAIVIHRLRPFRKMVFWDIGAGSGSVSLEISRLFPDARVYAIERDPAQIVHLKTNTEIFDSNINIINGEAPDVLMELPSPDRVFIGGSGGKLVDIIGHVHKRMSEGIITLNAVTLETLNTAMEILKKNSYIVDVIELSISRLRPLGCSHHLSGENPVFIITATRSCEIPS